jgi:hypothetical protein
LTFTCTALATCGRGFLELGSGSVRPSHDPPLWTTHFGRGRSFPFCFHVLHNTFRQLLHGPPTPIHNCRSGHRFSHETSFRTGPLVLTSAWKPARPGQSRRKGIHLRRKALLDIHPKPGCAGCATSRTQLFTQGSTLQIALPANPHAGGNASHWLSHCGVTSFRHAHVPPPVNDESHPQLQASSAPICMRTWTSQDALRRCPRPPGQHELDPRSRANSFYSFHICNPHPHASSPASCALCRGAYLKHGGQTGFEITFPD